MITKIKAFTLVELLVTVALVSILSAIALAQFQIYRNKANDAMALSQLVNARTAIEALFVTNSDPQSEVFYGGDGSTNLISGSILNLPGLVYEPDVAMWLHVGGTAGHFGMPGTKGSYSIWTAHCRGSIATEFSGNTVMKTFQTDNISNAAGGVILVGAGGFLKESEMSCPAEGFY